MIEAQRVPMPVSLGDYERLAERVLDANAWAYLAGGAGDEITLAENGEAYRRWRLMPRVLKQPIAAHTRVTLFGRELAHPILVAPVAYQRLFHPEGELASAIGASAQDALMVLSSMASVRLEDAAAAGPACRWLQLYMRPQREETIDLVRRAEASGYEALVVTVDAPLSGLRNREQRAAFRLPPDISAVNLGPNVQQVQQPLAQGESAVFREWQRMAIGWDDIAWLVSATKLPVVLKGIASPHDARWAMNAGVAGLIVSNHGGRVLDTVAASIELLPAVVEEIGGRMPVLVDGGIRRGTDVLKALALGANAVLVGRPAVYGLAVAGALGVSHVLRILRDELEMAMALTGCAALSEILPDRLLRA